MSFSSRKTECRRNRRKRRMSLERLEGRWMMSSGGTVPDKINPHSWDFAVNVSQIDSAYHAQGSAAITNNEIDYYRFRATETGVYRFMATTPASNLDTVLAVFDAGGDFVGKKLASNDDISGANRDSQAFAMLVRNHEYVFAVTNYQGTAGGSYTWDVQRTDDWYELTGGDTKQTAFNLSAITGRRVIPGNVLADGNDWFAFYLPTVKNEGTVKIRFDHALGDLDMAVYDTSGKQVGWSKGTGNEETVSLAGRSPGEYYVHVYGHQGASNPYYTLDLNPLGGGFQIDVTAPGFNATQRALIRQAADRWERVIASELPAATWGTQTVDDLSIVVTALNIVDPPNKNVLSQANYNGIRPNKGLPFHGFVNVDTDDLNNMVNGGGFQATMVHEMGHVLGIGTLWSGRGLLSGTTGTDPRFTGKQATAAYNQIFQRNDTGVPVEAGGGASTALAHWRESELTTEIMTGWVNGALMPLSRITVGGLADLGYSVNWAAADEFVPPPSIPGGGGYWGIALSKTQWNPASAALPDSALPSAGVALGQASGDEASAAWDALPGCGPHRPEVSKYALRFANFGGAEQRQAVLESELSSGPRTGPAWNAAARVWANMQDQTWHATPSAGTPVSAVSSLNGLEDLAATAKNVLRPVDAVMASFAASSDLEQWGEIPALSEPLCAKPLVLI